MYQRSCCLSFRLSPLLRCATNNIWRDCTPYSEICTIFRNGGYLRRKYSNAFGPYHSLTWEGEKQRRYARSWWSCWYEKSRVHGFHFKRGELQLEVTWYYSWYSDVKTCTRIRTRTEVWLITILLWKWRTHRKFLTWPLLSWWSAQDSNIGLEDSKHRS